MLSEVNFGSMKKKYKCNVCGASRIWLHNWAVAFGHCEGQFVNDWQRGQTLEQVKKHYEKYAQTKIDFT